MTGIATIRRDAALAEDFQRVADEVVAWHDREWPGPDGTPAEITRVCMKAAEELGELLGALVKHLQGRTDKDWLTAAEDEFGDVVIVLCTLAARIRSLRLESGTDGPPPGFMRMFLWRWRGRNGVPGVSERTGAPHRGDGAGVNEAISLHQMMAGSSSVTLDAPVRIVPVDELGGGTESPPDVEAAPVTVADDVAGMIARVAEVMDRIQASHPKALRLMAEIVAVTGTPSEQLLEEFGRRRAVFDLAWASPAAAGRGETSLTASLQSVLDDVQRGWLA